MIAHKVQSVSHPGHLLLQNPHYEPNNRLGEPQSQLGCFRGQKSILPLLGTEPQFLCNTAHGPGPILNTLPQLLSFINILKSGNFTKA